MKLYGFIFLCVFVTSSMGATTYTTQYDSIDLDEVLNNQRLYKTYIDCLTNQGRCTPDGKILKESLPEAIKSDCAKCTEAQRQRTDKVIKHLINEKPEDYAKLEKIYDPNGEYKQKYDKKLAKLTNSK